MGLNDRFEANLDLDHIIVKEFTYDPSNLADGAGETKSVTVTGAELGDFVLVAAPYDLQDVIVTGYVQAQNTVEIRLQNESTGAINLASGTWRVCVIKVKSASFPIKGV